MQMQCDFVGLIVADVAAATAFYRDQLGWPVDEAASMPGRFTQFALGGDTTVALLAQQIGPAGQQMEPGLLVEDVDAAYAQWQARGVEMVEAPNDRPFGRTFLFRSPDGHVWRVYAHPQAA
jgi:predicted enzyme related to lactoylglutathione lyase